MIDSTPSLFKHTARPEWGHAVVAWERDSKTGFLFENGMVRQFADRFVEKMEPVELVTEDLVELAARLTKQREGGKVNSKPQTPAAPVITFSLPEQLEYFQRDYGDAFNDEAWQEKMREGKGKRRLKRHRDAAIADAAENFTQEALDAFAAAADGPGAWTAVVNILSATDLVPTAQVEALRGKTDGASAESIETLKGLLAGDDPFEQRFDRYVAALKSFLGAAPSWELASAIPALVAPADCVPVRRTGFEKQAAWAMPELSVSKLPSGVGYLGYCRLAKSLFDALAEEGPSDLIDIYDFIRLTTSPTAQRELLITRHQKVSEAEAAGAEASGDEATDAATEESKSEAADGDSEAADA